MFEHAWRCKNAVTVINNVQKLPHKAQGTMFEVWIQPWCEPRSYEGHVLWPTSQLRPLPSVSWGVLIPDAPTSSLVSFPWHQIQLFCHDPRQLVLSEIVSFNICMRIPGLHYVTPPLSAWGHWNICSIWWSIQSYVHKHLSWDESCNYFHSITHFKQIVRKADYRCKHSITYIKQASKTWMNVILGKWTFLSSTKIKMTLQCGNETLEA